jgi:hypothetical protein
LSASTIAAPYGDLWDYWAAHQPASNKSVDHQNWQSILDKHVSASSDGINRVDYRGFSAADKQQLEDYLTYMSALRPTQLSREQQLPYWINLYNALTVRVVLQHPDKDSIKQMKSTLFSFGPWDDEQTTIEGFSVTLNDIEHRILRPIWRDYRIHYAVNCASISCPNLSARAYTANNAQTMFAEAERNYLQHPRGLTFTQSGKLKLSSIFDWYQEDFGTSEKELVNYLAQIRSDLSSQLRNYSGSIEYHYDWSLNSQRAASD